MAISDANYCFTLVDIGAQGRNSDGGIFKDSLMRQAFYENRINVPDPTRISDKRTDVPYVLVGDEAFALTYFLMRPFPGKSLTKKKRIYNYRLSRERRVVENTFGILVARWRIFHRPINTSLETVDAVVKATVCLHNYLKKSEEMCPNSEKHYCPTNFSDTELPNGVIVKGAWRSSVSNAVVSVGRQGTNNFSVNASDIRNIFMEYFNMEGAAHFRSNVQL